MTDLTKTEGSILLSISWGIILFALFVTSTHFQPEEQLAGYLIFISAGVLCSVIFSNMTFGFIKWDQIGQSQWK